MGREAPRNPEITLPWQLKVNKNPFYPLDKNQKNFFPMTTGQTPDIDCGPTKLQYCNNAKWSDRSWANGNIPGLNLVDPIRKDTIIIPTGGYAVSYTFSKPFINHCLHADNTHVKFLL